MLQDRTGHTIELAAVLLDDIELSRLKPEELLLKASRLARLVEDSETWKWLRFELYGYSATDPLAERFMKDTGRWPNSEDKPRHGESFPRIIDLISIKELELQRMVEKQPRRLDTGLIQGVDTDLTIDKIVLTHELAHLRMIRLSVIDRLHEFVTSTYYELAFSTLAGSIFEKHKLAIDALLRGTAGDALEKIPSIYDRLATGDPEAVSQALNTCRRLIDAFADAVYPPKDSPVDLGGTNYEVGEKNHLNRITAYLHERCTSASRRKRLRRTLRMLYERICTGIHSDVTGQEARSLFLLTYLTVGEILSATSQVGSDK